MDRPSVDTKHGHICQNAYYKAVIRHAKQRLVAHLRHPCSAFQFSGMTSTGNQWKDTTKLFVCENVLATTPSNKFLLSEVLTFRSSVTHTQL